MTTSEGKGLRVVRGHVAHCLRDPGPGGDVAALESYQDGVLVIEDGRIARIGPAAPLMRELPADVPVEEHANRLVVPGFVDTHVHYPQTDMIASYGEQLLSWLNRYTFPAEGQFADQTIATDTAQFFLDELLRNGTTSALVLGTVHPQSADALFEAARRRGMRLAAGKVLMDRNCPDYLQDSAESGYRDSKALIERWHGVDRLSYAITPRFAPTSTEAQLELAGRLAREHPEVYLHTHVAENRDEVAWVAELFPWSRSYLDVYDRFGLVRERAVYAHCIYLDEQDRRRMAAAGAVAAFCPTSNLFLGSGLFDMAAARSDGVRVGVGTDVGGGTSFSMFRTMAEAYKVAQLKGESLSPARLLYLATLAGAEALYLDHRIGSFQPGREADFLVLDPAATPLLARRSARTRSLEELLFALFILGDDRNVAGAYLQGQRVYSRV